MAKKKGLGDIVQDLAKPIAKMSDKYLNTEYYDENDDLQCEDCQKNRDLLNKIAFKKKPTQSDEVKELERWLGLEILRLPTKSEIEILGRFYDDGSKDAYQHDLLDIIKKTIGKEFRWTNCSPCNAGIAEIGQRIYDVSK